MPPEDLKTKIDVYSQDATGKKIVIGKKLYSAEDSISGKESGLFYDVIIYLLKKEYGISSNDIVNLTYPDHQTMNPRTLTITITHYIEKQKQ